MRKKEMRFIPPVEGRYEESITDVVCDLCGRGGGQYESFGNATTWPTSKGEHAMAKVSITLEESSHYPEGGWGKIYGLDCCPECFRNAIQPLFEAKGGQIHVNEIDY